MGLMQRIFGGGGGREAAALYNALVRAGRDPAWYSAYGVADSFDGRYDMIVLEVALAARRLRLDGSKAGLKRQKALLGVFFADMDRSLREMGVGDLSVGKKIKAMADAFHGRALAYDDCLPADLDGLKAALLRNVYRGEADRDGEAARLAAYVVRRAADWDALPISELLAGNVPATPVE